MIDPADLRAQVMRPALAATGLGGDAAEELLLGTALQESGGGLRLAQRGGPARGVWQMEPATLADIERNYLAFRPALAQRIAALAAPGLGAADQLAGNLYYACAMARLVYARAGPPLPASGDLAAQAAYYKAHYNTPQGAATEAEYIANWRAAMR